MGQKNWGKLIIALGLSLSLLGTSTTVHAQTSVASLGDEMESSTSEVKYSGIDGTCQWYISDDDTLHIESGTLQAGSLGKSLTSNENEYPNVKFDSIKQDIKKISIDGNVILPANSSWLFTGIGNNTNGISGITEIKNGERLNTSNVTNMSHMFDGLGNLTVLDVSTWDISHVSNMSYMFSDTGLSLIDVSTWDTGNVLNMRHMFSADNTTSNLQQLDVSNWNVSNVSDMSAMFMKDQQLKVLDISNWDVHKVIKMNDMFSGASGLRKLDFSKWQSNAKTTGFLTGTNLNRIRLSANFHLKNSGLGQDTSGNTNHKEWLVTKKGNKSIISSKKLLKGKYLSWAINAKGIEIFDVNIPNNLNKTILNKNVKGSVKNGIATLTIKVPERNGYKANKSLLTFTVNVDKLQASKGKYVITSPEKVTYKKVAATKKVNQLVATRPQRKVTTLFDNDTKALSNSLTSATNWFSDRQMKLKGVTYYRVATDRWVKSGDVYTYEPQSATIKTGDLDQVVMNSQGQVINNRKLDSETTWKTDRLANINGKTYYRVATNEFVPTNDVTIV
ncbi:BspA family leucine-rich repeat surface protein [Companilactobacillus alimentarius]